MRDTLDIPTRPVRVVDPLAKGRSLHALGSFYLRQGFPKQGLSLLLAAQDYGIEDVELDRAIAHAYLLCGAPKQTLDMLDAMEGSHGSARMRDSALLLRSRALLALGRVEEARAAYAAMGRQEDLAS
jgi:hypothetical protein